MHCETNKKLSFYCYSPRWVTTTFSTKCNNILKSECMTCRPTLKIGYFIFIWKNECLLFSLFLRGTVWCGTFCLWVFCRTWNEDSIFSSYRGKDNTSSDHKTAIKISLLHDFMFLLFALFLLHFTFFLDYPKVPAVFSQPQDKIPP